MEEQSDLTLPASTFSSDKHNQLSHRFMPKHQLPLLELNRFTLPNQKKKKEARLRGRGSFPVIWKCVEVFYHLFYPHA